MQAQHPGRTNPAINTSTVDEILDAVEEWLDRPLTADNVSLWALTRDPQLKNYRHEAAFTVVHSGQPIEFRLRAHWAHCYTPSLTNGESTKAYYLDIQFTASMATEKLPRLPTLLGNYEACLAGRCHEHPPHTPSISKMCSANDGSVLEHVLTWRWVTHADITFHPPCIVFAR